MSANDDRIVNEHLMRAVAHPLRVEILVALSGKDELSPTQISKRLGRQLDSVSYHVNVLRECGAVELVKTQRRRGGLEHSFRPAASIQGFIDLAAAAFGHDAPG
jgi:DNA-binding transcriptional ArsR family regulator